MYPIQIYHMLPQPQLMQSSQILKCALLIFKLTHVDKISLYSPYMLYSNINPVINTKMYILYTYPITPKLVSMISIQKNWNKKNPKFVRIAPSNHSTFLKHGPLLPSTPLTFAFIASPTQHIIYMKKILLHPNTKCTTISFHLCPEIIVFSKKIVVVIHTLLTLLLYPSQISISLVICLNIKFSLLI
jgi:hypothetical protein